MAADNPFHQFQMILKPLEKALRQENVEAALRFAGHLFEIGGGASAHEERKVHFLLRSMEAATPSVKTAFTAKVLERFGGQLTAGSRERLAGRLERL